jgi:hypothetical protein
VTVIQEHTPPQMLGRVFGALTALAQAGIPVGAVLAGLAVQQLGLVPTILVTGAIYLLVSLAMVFNRSLHQMDAGRQAAWVGCQGQNGGGPAGGPTWFRELVGNLAGHPRGVGSSCPARTHHLP